MTEAEAAAKKEKASPTMDREAEAVFSVFESRHSVRSFSDKPVEKWKLDKILEAIQSAPSAGNLQAFRVIVCPKAKGPREALYTHGSWAEEAPYQLVFCALRAVSEKKYGSRGKRLYSVQDATIAASYAQIAIHALGLGTCWLGAFDEDRVAAILGIDPKVERPVAILPFGYDASKEDSTDHQAPKKRRRRDIKDMATFV